MFVVLGRRSNEGPSEVGRSGCEGGEGDAGSWWESRGGS